MSHVNESQVSPMSGTLMKRRPFHFFGLTQDDLVSYFFRGNAVVAVLVLALITIFLFREGAGFLSQNARNLRSYRLAGLEYVDFIRREMDEYAKLTRALSTARLAQVTQLTSRGKSIAETNAALESFDRFSELFGGASEQMQGILSDLTEAATATKQKAQVAEDLREQKAMLLRLGQGERAGQIEVTPVDFASDIAALRTSFPALQKAHLEFASKLDAALTAMPVLPDSQLRGQLESVKANTRRFIAVFPATERAMLAWQHDRPIAWTSSVTSFLLGREWLTASFWQDWYGLVPLLVGSLLVSFIAMVIAVPLGISAAIYVSEIAGRRERNFIKPFIEFISAIPSVVLGFFGIAVLGTALRAASQVSWLAWVPGFPMSERLNSLNAGCLLAFMAIPTIFSLAEDALNNVPRHFKEASYALGANRFQTISRILIPASLSGMISAVLLGFGRVIGETMVVLLCAGNRIAIPDFTQGLGAFFQPVHTMTGIIAQEMGEVVPESLHYRALFMVGIVLFLLALATNFVAQKILQRPRIAMS